jgi:hypothetical protein
MICPDPIAGTISTNNEMRGYIKYLIDRFNELASKGDRKGRVFKPAVIYSNINKEFGSKWDYISESRFPDLVTYLQKKISGTEMGYEAKVAIALPVKRWKGSVRSGDTYRVHL